MGKKRIQPNYRRRTLRLPDLDHSKLAALNSLGSPGSRRVYEFALDQFIAWYCSEPRLALNRIVVTRYRMYLESRGLAANTINQQLAAVRRLAHEAADAGLLSPELAAGISRVRGVKQLGFYGREADEHGRREIVACRSTTSNVRGFLQSPSGFSHLHQLYRARTVYSGLSRSAISCPSASLPSLLYWSRSASLFFSRLVGLRAQTGHSRSLRQKVVLRPSGHSHWGRAVRRASFASLTNRSLGTFRFHCWTSSAGA
jgi:hypothetical protein